MALDIALTAGTLAPPACYQTEQERLEAFVAATSASATGGIQWQAGTTAPSDLTLYWLVTDVNGRPLDIMKYSVSDGAWVRVLSTIVFCGDAGSTAINDLTVAPVPAFLTNASAYQYGRMYVFKCPNNTTGPVTIRVNGLAQKAITKRGTTALANGDMLVGQMVFIVFDGTQFQLLSQPSSTAVAVADIAPGTEDQVMSTTATPAAAWLTRSYNTPSGSEVAIPSAGSSVTFNHGLTKGGSPKQPSGFMVKLRCTAGPDAGFSTGDEVDVNSAFSSGGTNWCTTWSTDIVVGLVFDSGASGPQVSNKSTGASTAIDHAKWKLAAEAHW